MSLLLLFGGGGGGGGTSCPIGTVWAAGSWADTAWVCNSWADAAGGGGFVIAWGRHCNIILQPGRSTL